MNDEELKREAERIFQAGLAAVDPAVAVQRHLSRRGGRVVVSPPTGPEREVPVDRVVVVGAGKASAPMCRAVEEQLGDLVAGGLVITRTGHAVPTRRVDVVEASHPVPDERGADGARRVLELVTGLGQETLVVAVLSGGGSALLPLPAEDVPLSAKQRVTELLLAAGADIGEINAVRKHLSAIKGGCLARRAHPAPVVALILSDVVGDRLDVIASGPTVPDPSTFADAREVLERYGLVSAAPAPVLERIDRGVRGEVEETPKPGDPRLEGCVNVLVANNAVAVQACRRAAEAGGWHTLLLSTRIEGEAREVARVLAAIAREVRRSGNPVPAPACIISGGETTVTLRGVDGLGGRNQELALAAALDLDGEDGIAVFSAGTDGTDGPTDAAGAVAFGSTQRRARALGLDARAHLDRNDAYHFFDPLGDLIRTGPTLTNVMDIQIVLVS
jgi:hydroxypyruvate reductase